MFHDVSLAVFAIIFHSSTDAMSSTLKDNVRLERPRIYYFQCDYDLQYTGQTIHSVEERSEEHLVQTVTATSCSGTCSELQT